MSRRDGQRSFGRRAAGAGRTLAVLFFCAGIALLGLLGGGEHRRATARRGADPMARYFPAEMPRYPGAREVPAGPATRVGRSQQRMSLFFTDHEPDRVARFYTRHWRARRLWVRSDVTHRGGVVSAIDEARGRIYQVLLLTRGGRTTVLPSVTRAPMTAGSHGATRPPVPLFEDSKVLLSLTTKDGGAEARIVMAINAGGLAATLQHYRQALSAAGYRPVRTKGGLADGRRPGDPAKGNKGDKASQARPGDHRVLLYGKPGGEEVTINLTALGKERVRVHIVAVGS